jgi:hypothetical protein
MLLIFDCIGSSTDILRKEIWDSVDENVEMNRRYYGIILHKSLAMAKSRERERARSQLVERNFNMLVQICEKQRQLRKRIENQ